jgi:hypothetical protein
LKRSAKPNNAPFSRSRPAREFTGVQQISLANYDEVKQRSKQRRSQSSPRSISRLTAYKWRVPSLPTQPQTLITYLKRSPGDASKQQNTLGLDSLSLAAEHFNFGQTILLMKLSEAELGRVCPFCPETLSCSPANKCCLL